MAAATVHELVGQAGSLDWVVLKTVVLIVVAVVGFRVGQRRTYAELTAIDFAVAVAMGAVIGRTATSSRTSLLTGVVGLVALFVLHWAITKIRRLFRLRAVFDQPPNVLVVHGQLQQPALARAGLTDEDVYVMLRQREVGALGEVAYLLYEGRGGVSLQRADRPIGPLMREALQRAGAPLPAAASD